MAHLLQRLIAAAFLINAAQAADFSHAMHLKLKPDCTSCHTKATTSTKLADNLLPTADSCVACHKDAKVIKAPRRLRLQNFNHELHVKMGNVAPVLQAAAANKTYLEDATPAQEHWKTKNACAACHRGIESSTAIKADAKEHFPHMADCLVCHNKIDPPFSCETCHGTDKALKSALHTPDYLDTHTKKSEKQGCAICHGRKFTCLGCHG